jgi:DNA-binding NarL/FixJ family response regulator
MTDANESVAVLVDDMFFSVKINAAVSACNRVVKRIKSREQLEALVADPPSLIIVDLNSDRLDPLEAIHFLKGSTELGSVSVVAFVSHVQTELIRSAQSAGCDYVLPRSAFIQRLTEIAAGNLSVLRTR